MERRRFSLTARMWLARHPPPADAVLIEDAVFVSPHAWPVHVANTFEIEGT